VVGPRGRRVRGGSDCCRHSLSFVGRKPAPGMLKPADRSDITSSG
jgi:hypothetical protein